MRHRTEDVPSSSAESTTAAMSAADMFSTANRDLNRKNQRAKHAAMEKTLKAEDASEMKAAEDKARADAHAEATRMEAEQDTKVEESAATNATKNATVTVEENATENATAETPAPVAAVAPTKKPTPVAQPELAPPDADEMAGKSVEAEEAKFPTDWIKNDVKFNVDKPTSTREDNVADQVKKQQKWKTSTEVP